MNKEVDQPKGPDSQEQGLPKIGKEKLREILGQHKRWVESGGKEGARAGLIGADLREANLGGAYLQGADLDGANLQGANLHGAKLQKAYLIEANLQKANLSRANLQGANLRRANVQGAVLIEADLQGAHLIEANLRKADLCRAKLQEADLSESDLSGADLTKANLQGAELAMVKGLTEARLQNANLEGATGLLGTEFARADVTGASLPEDIREFKTLQTVAETSKNARKIFLSMLLGCAYSVLTIATTTDARLLTNSSTSPLPIIGTEIPIAWFYWAAPFVLVMVYVYLHFYLGMLWEGLAGLPAKFPDGKRLDERAYPWLLNGLVRRHFDKLQKGRPVLVKFKELTAIFLAWWTVPLTLLAFWVRYLPRRHWAGTWWHIGLLVSCIAIGIIFYRDAARMLRGDESLPVAWKTSWRDRRTQVVLLGVLLSVLSFGAIEGFLGAGPYPADLEEAEVSIRPDNWTGIGKPDELRAQIAQVKPARLSGMDLRYALADGAFLVKAELGGANLQGADLIDANLQGASLQLAKLEGARLVRANLKGADHSYANLQGANLREAEGLTQEQLKQAINWALADYSKALLVSLGLPPEHNERLKMNDLSGYELGGANLEGAVLTRADLRGANLQGANLYHAELQRADLSDAKLQGARLVLANLKGATLSGANLQRADLRSARGLTQEQLDRACGDGKTKLPPGMSIEPCPEEKK